MSDVQYTPPPRQVLLFSGHMIDAPDRATPRFPPDKAPVAAAAIDDALKQLDANESDLAICSGACGGDLLFAEACLARGLRLELYLPFEEPAFLAGSVDFAKANWHARYLAVRSRARLHVLPAELGPLPPDENPYARTNLWMLDAALRLGAEKIAFICLWNGQGGDAPGGTEHFMNEASRKTQRIIWLDTRRLWG
ncbi:MAG: hypothetical protein LBE59_03205 [Nevskiaceae bacterium]|jgi:hypothetical protein|nr:hypothetical protein [Nevskiaceae bacterium]